MKHKKHLQFCYELYFTNEGTHMFSQLASFRWVKNKSFADYTLLLPEKVVFIEQQMGMFLIEATAILDIQLL